MESRQVKRARLRQEAKTGNNATHKLYYILMKRTSQSGVEYTYYKGIVDTIGLGQNNEHTTSEDTINTGDGQG